MKLDIVYGSLDNLFVLCEAMLTSPMKDETAVSGCNHALSSSRRLAK